MYKKEYGEMGNLWGVTVKIEIFKKQLDLIESESWWKQLANMIV